MVVADVSGPQDFHLGDEAMLEANLRTLRKLAPHVEFTVLSGDPAWTSRYYGVRSLHSPCIPSGHTARSWTRKLVEADDPEAWACWLGERICAALRNCAGLVISGGGNLCATWPEHVLERVALIELAHRQGIPSIMTGQTLGPSLTPDQRQLLARALPKLTWLGVREQGSAVLARSLGVAPETTHEQLDDAFCLEPLVPAEESTRCRFSGRERWIAVTLDASFAAPGRDRALQALAGQLDSLAESLAASIVFVPHVRDGASSDALAGKALATLLGNRLLQLDLMQPREVRWLMGQASLVVSTRYHPLVFAAAAGTPALGVWTDDYTRVKLRGAMAPAGLEGYCIPLDEAERGAFLPLALELWHWKDAVRNQLTRLQREAEAWEAERWSGICRSLNFVADGEPSHTPQRRVSIGPLDRFASSAPGILTSEQWHRYDREGYLRLGKLLDEEQLTILRERMDAIRSGRIHDPMLETRSDTGSGHGEVAVGAEALSRETPRCDRIEGLEADPLVLELIRRDVFREICTRHYGSHASVSVLRIMMRNIPAGQGACLPWHQDGGDLWNLDRDPLVTLWVALDPSTRVNGCVQVIPGSHRLGLLSKNGSNFSTADLERHCDDDAIEYLEVGAGEGLLMHNWLIHRSGVNQTDASRRALTACYMDGRTMNTLSGKRYPVIFGDYSDIESAMPFLRELREENRSLREAANEAERFAKSLVEDNQRREQMRCEAEKYAKSLEAEITVLRKSRRRAGTF